MTPMRRYLLVAAMTPIITAGGLAVSSSIARAGDAESCRCKPSKCTDADSDCYILTCSDDTTKVCDGKSIT